MTIWDFANHNPLTAAFIVAILAFALVEVITKTLKARNRQMWLRNVERHGWPNTVYVDGEGNPVLRPEIEPARTAQPA